MGCPKRPLSWLGPSLCPLLPLFHFKRQLSLARSQYQRRRRTISLRGNVKMSKWLRCFTKWLINLRRENDGELPAHGPIVKLNQTESFKEVDV